MIAPLLLGRGTKEQKDYYIPRIINGDDYWCQGYSEPGAGSDLASLQCKAVRQGDKYIINGTKIWTTHAHLANKIFCLVRTDNSGKNQEGITFLMMDMHQPGVKVEPLLTMAKDHDFNQVVFTDAEAHVKDRIGKENEGWAVAKYLLEYETIDEDELQKLFAGEIVTPPLVGETLAHSGEEPENLADKKTPPKDIEPQAS